MLKGLLLKESLTDLRILDTLHITQTETWNIESAAPGQEPVWTAMRFEVGNDQADALAESLSRVLKPQGWYIDAALGDWMYVIFPGKVFKYIKGDRDQRAAAQEYGRLCAIPEKQLDWGE
jgi:hypothetical protein